MRRRTIVAIVCAIAVVLVVGGYVVARFSSPHPDSDSSTSAREAAAAPTAHPYIPQSDLEISTDEAAPVSADTVASLWSSVQSVSAEGKWVAWAHVIDAQTGETLLSSNAEQGHTPASITKVLTAATAVTHLEENRHLATGVSLRGTDLFLWGEGDILLSRGEGNPNAVNGRAGVADLAEAAAARLKEAGKTSVTLYWQGQPFSGPSRLFEWDEQGVTNYEGNVAAFAIDAGRVDVHTYAFLPDPGQDVAVELADHLQLNGISASVASEGTVPDGAEEIARIESATIGQQIRWMLHTSDNTVADQYCRLAAQAAGYDPSYEGATSNIVSTVQNMGIDATGLNLDDCSGLSDQNAIPPAVLTSVLRHAMTSERVDLRDLPRDLPWGGLQGTMGRRYLDGPAAANVQAKTGSLASVSTLAGVVDTSTGRTLIFAVGADNVPDNGAYALRPYLDQFVQNLASL